MTDLRFPTRSSPGRGLAHLKNRNLRTVDGPWARQVKVHTVSKISKWIPELQDSGPAAGKQDAGGGKREAK